MWERRSNLLYAKNMRWTSQKLLAAKTPQEVMGGRAWASLGHEDSRLQMAFVLWANSTLGMAVHWTRGQRTQAGRSPTQIGALSSIPVPRLDQLDETSLDEAAATFDSLTGKPLKPACQAHSDPLRDRIDEAVVSMFGLPEGALEAVRQIRLLWCHEPSVHGGNKSALALLRREGG